jgi:hypothetical protein
MNVLIFSGVTSVSIIDSDNGGRGDHYIFDF